MPLKERRWWPIASGTGWGLLVLALVLVNSGSVLLAVLVGAFVGVLSWRLALPARQRPGGSAEQ